MTNTLAGIVLTVFGSRIGRSMFRQQATNQGVAIFIGAALQTFSVAAKEHAHKLHSQQKGGKRMKEFSAMEETHVQL